MLNLSHLLIMKTNALRHNLPASETLRGCKLLERCLITQPTMCLVPVLPTPTDSVRLLRTVFVMLYSFAISGPA